MANSKLRTELKSSSITSRRTGLKQTANRPGLPAANGLLDPVFKHGTNEVVTFSAVVE